MLKKTPDSWKKDAMQRPNMVDAIEIERRREIAAEHYRNQGSPDADTLADHQLYILGKMELDEYCDYLLFKGMYGIKAEGEIRDFSL